MNPLKFPHLDKYINDFSWVFPEEQRNTLNETLATHEQQTTEQVVVILFPHRQWHELLDIGLKVFNENGIGQKNLNNGLLLIVATEEKKIRIVVGKWLELKYTEMVCRDIIENHLRPLLNQGKYKEMITTFWNIITEEVTSRTSKSTFTPTQNRKDQNLIKLLHYFGGISIIFSLFMINGYISAVIGIILSIVLSFFIHHLRIDFGGTPIKKKILFIAPLSIFLISIIALLTPASCLLKSEYSSGGKLYSCQRNIFWSQYNYEYSVGWSSYSSSSHWSSSDSSSSFWWGGWSSNGGGYGD
jgi:uncharacterized protein